MNQKYAVGTCVKTNSGGPSMTVYEYHEKNNFHDECYFCQWFEGKKIEVGNFTFSSLEEVKTGK